MRERTNINIYNLVSIYDSLKTMYNSDDSHILSKLMLRELLNDNINLLIYPGKLLSIHLNHYISSSKINNLLFLTITVRGHLKASQNTLNYSSRGNQTIVEVRYPTIHH